jgi:D-alanyl-D-alanine dipeptidase
LAGCSQKANAPEKNSESRTSSTSTETISPLPAGFVYVNEEIPSVLLDIRYYSDNNLVGTQIDGYKAPAAILTREAATALQAVSEDLGRQGYALKIFDTYRPTKAVDHFLRWSKDLNDQKMKAEYYPNVNKQDLFYLGYLGAKSGHSRGSTIDLTLVNKQTSEEIDMGSHWDLLDPRSAWDTTLITPQQSANRQVLKNAMQNHGFKTIRTEWWHWTLIKEPYPNKYFNFDVR